MSKKKKLLDTNNEPVVNKTGDEYSDFVAEDVIDSVNYIEDFTNDVETDYSPAISQFAETEDKFKEVVLPVKCRVGKDKIVVDYKGFGLVVNIADSNVNKITLKVYGNIGSADFRYEVV